MDEATRLENIYCSQATGDQLRRCIRRTDTVQGRIERNWLKTQPNNTLVSRAIFTRYLIAVSSASHLTATSTYRGSSTSVATSSSLYRRQSRPMYIV